MTSIYETTDRLIGEQLDALLAVGWGADDLLRAATVDQTNNPFVRLVGAARSLCRQHGIDAKGRCRICTKRRRFRRARARPCTVYAAFSFFLTQPDELVLREIPRPTTVQRLPPFPDSEETIRLPRIRNS